MVASLWDIVAAVVGTALIAAPLPVVPLPQSTDFFAETSGHLSLANFSTDPTHQGKVLADQTDGPKLEAFIFNSVDCPFADGTLTYRLYVANTGNEVARNLVIQYKYPDNSSFVSASIEPQSHDEEKKILTWSIDALAPFDGYTQFSVVVRSGGGAQTSSLTVDYEGPARVTTSYTTPNNCDGVPPLDPKPASKNPLPAIICDPAELNCVSFLPTLGIRFGKATPPQEGPALQAELEARGAIANIIPGECRVLADEIITSPGYHDALNRQYEPAAFFMDPLYRSGEDFKTLVAQNTLLGFTYIKQTKPKVSTLHQKWWREHVRLAGEVLKGDLDPDQGRGRSDALLPRWQADLQSTQQGFRTAYVQLQNNRRIKLPPILERALANARTSMQRACNENSDGGLAALLPGVQQAYETNLTRRVDVFDDMQDKHRELTPFTAIWIDHFYPALEAYKGGNKKPLEVYLQREGAFFESAFKTSFNLYFAHLEGDMATFHTVRLSSFEKALDTPKTAATRCEKEKVFESKVEETFCESALFYGQTLSQQGRQAQADNPDAQPYTLPPVQQSVIDENQVKGVACSGRPGDPWWSTNCECQCNENITAGQFDINGNPLITACQARFDIIRHDIAVSNQLECLATFPKHLNSFIKENQ